MQYRSRQRGLSLNLDRQLLQPRYLLPQQCIHPLHHPVRFGKCYSATRVWTHRVMRGGRGFELDVDRPNQTRSIFRPEARRCIRGKTFDG